MAGVPGTRSRRRGAGGDPRALPAERAASGALRRRSATIEKRDATLTTGESPIYDVPGYPRWRILIDRHGEWGWLDEHNHNHIHLLLAS
jgi:hypothetical protein